MAKSRNTKRYHAWRVAVLTKDGYRCQRCGTPERLEAHHVKPWNTAPDLRYEVENGQTLCSPCHVIVEGALFTPEARKKSADARRGRPLPERQRRLLSAALTGRPKTEAHKAALRKPKPLRTAIHRLHISESRRGKGIGHVVSAETREKIAAAQRGKPKSIEVRMRMAEAQRLRFKRASNA